VEAVETPQAPSEKAPASTQPSVPGSAPSGSTASPAGGEGASAGSPPIEEHPKKFSKKY
jgi:hypothetical protein